MWGWEVHNRLRAFHAFPDCQESWQEFKDNIFLPEIARYTTEKCYNSEFCELRVLT